MPIFYGKSADGSDMKEFEGVYVHPNGEEWSNKPYPKSKPHKHAYRQHIDQNGNIQYAEWICDCGKHLNHN